MTNGRFLLLILFFTASFCTFWGLRANEPTKYDVRLVLIPEKDVYFYGEPIGFKAVIQSYEKIPLTIIDVDWEWELLFTVKRDPPISNESEWKEWKFVENLVEHYSPAPHIRTVDTPSVVTLREIPPNGKIESPLLNLAYLEKAYIRDYFGKSGRSLFRDERDAITITIQAATGSEGTSNSIYNLVLQKIESAPLVITIKQPETQRERDALRLLDVCARYTMHLSWDHITDEDVALAARYGIFIDRQKKEMPDPPIESNRIIRDNFSDTIYGAEAGYLLATLLEAEEKVDEAKEAYRWVLEHHPNSWWAQLSQKRLTELQK
ncbi:MAG: tetratricopeptide repeat protein [Planctomycetota bacterium]|nr:tetratricopeptide repeat protein [Planctomycetota bacterium]